MKTSTFGILCGGGILTLVTGLFLFTPEVDDQKMGHPQQNLHKTKTNPEWSINDIRSLRNDINETISYLNAMDHAITGLSHAMEMMCSGMKGSVSESDLEDIGYQIASLREIVNEKIDHPTEIIVSPEAIPDREKDAEILKTINETIQDLHSRTQKIEGAVRSLIKSDRFTQKAIDDISNALGALEDSLSEEKGKISIPIYSEDDEEETFEEEEDGED